MTDVGLFVCTLCWIAWFEWRDYRRVLQWRADQELMNAAKKADADLLIARQATVMAEAMRQAHHQEEDPPKS